MCGITAYIGKNNVKKELLDSLKLLEYRGYDSAGMALQTANRIKIIRSVGNIANLEKSVNYSIKANCGIAHTRWATHGKPSLENTHPHTSHDSTWTLVHNGIIENYAELKKQLSPNVKFYGETDTEVIANLLAENKQSSPMQTLVETCNKMLGSFALACMHKSKKNTLFLARRKSPLYVAMQNNQTFVASDPACFVGKVENYYCLNDDEFCEATNKNLTFFNKNGEKIAKNSTKTENIDTFYSKNDFSHYMLKEINEVPDVLNRICKAYQDNNILSKFDAKFVNNFSSIMLVGCGTAYHAALMGEKYIEQLARIKCSSYIASEFRYSNPIIDEKTLCIFVSQSGETADTLACCELAKSCGATTIALTNVLYSSLAKMAHIVLPVCAGPEIAVASTKAYSAQIAILYMFANHLANITNNKKCLNYLNDINNLSKSLKINYNIDRLSKEISSQDKVFFIGRNFDYITCKEASLKLKEITYINTAEHPAGELKHGFLSLVDNSTILFVVATNKALLDKTLNGAHEAYSRGGKIVFVSQFDLPQEKTKDFYKVIKLKKHDELLMPIASISFFQLLAYKTSIAKNLNPDQPRNLAKSVTVE
ncbi:MAG: glutamine--fructose-6-phosphate transaminase (isomerizing) [Clostridiales bacterium]|nr:glutamine--fructose-6-phosphate transaminase (isomerizing) [Clostridiales bacterium]